MTEEKTKKAKKTAAGVTSLVGKKVRLVASDAGLLTGVMVAADNGFISIDTEEKGVLHFNALHVQMIQEIVVNA